MALVNPTGKHGRKRRHHGDGTVCRRNDRWRRKPWAAVIPFIDPSGQRRETWLSAASRDEAERLLSDELDRRRRKIVATEHTVGSYVRDWLMSGDFSPSTYDRYRNHVGERIVKTLGDVRLDALTPPQVRAALGTWTGSASTRGGTLMVLRSAMRQAVADRMRETDPTEGVKAPTIRDEGLTVLDVAEAKKLLATVEGERFAPILITALGLGIRRGECLGLRTPDVDARAGTLTIAKQLRRVPVSTRAEGDGWWRLVDPKAGSARTIPLPAFVAEALAARIEVRDTERRRSRVYADNDFVFCAPDGNPVSFTSLDRWFKAALGRAGLPDMRWHELRASTATILLAEGVPDITVMQILGHKTLEMTRRYVKLLPRVSQDAADRLDRAIGG